MAFLKGKNFPMISSAAKNGDELAQKILDMLNDDKTTQEELDKLVAEWHGQSGSAEEEEGEEYIDLPSYKGGQNGSIIITEGFLEGQNFDSTGELRDHLKNSKEERNAVAFAEKSVEGLPERKKNARMRFYNHIIGHPNFRKVVALRKEMKEIGEKLFAENPSEEDYKKFADLRKQCDELENQIENDYYKKTGSVFVVKPYEFFDKYMEE